MRLNLVFCVSSISELSSDESREQEVPSLASVSNHSDHQKQRFPSCLNTMNLTGRVEVFLFLLLPPVQRKFSFINHSLNYHPQSWKKS